MGLGRGGREVPSQAPILALPDALSPAELEILSKTLDGLGAPAYDILRLSEKILDAGARLRSARR